MKNNKEIIELFNNSGLLVRTVQLKDLGKNFKDLDDSIETALIKYKEDNRYYGPKRKWSVGHSSIAPLFYNFGQENNKFTRHLAILVDPSFYNWSKYTAISVQDMSSNSKFTEDEKLLNSDEAQCLYNSVINELKSRKDQNQNSEIVTCGFNIDSFCGLLFSGNDSWYEDNITGIRKQLGVLKERNIITIPIFKCVQQHEKTILTYWKELQM